jgi:AraC-like DNA-binding protein
MGRLATRRATEPLRALLARDFVGFEDTSPAFGTWLMPASGTATVIVNLGTPLSRLPMAFVAGLEDAWSLTERRTGTVCLDLKFTPLGAFQLLGTPMEELSGRVVDLADVVGPAASGLVQRLGELPTWDERFDLVERFLLDRAVGGPRPSPPVAVAVERLTSAAGQVSIAELVADSGWSHRHFIARFRREVGLAPKTLARVLRFDRLLSDLGREGGEWADVAARGGYADQSHLIREFRQLAGTTPTEYLGRDLGGGHVVGDAVNSVQDLPRRRR